MAEREESLLLRIPEAADRLGVGRSTLYLLLNRRELPVVRIGRSVRIPREALDVWLRQRLTEAE